MYKCCSSDDSDGICGSQDSDVLCSNQLDGYLKYQVCYQDSLSCGSNVIFMVNETLQTSTTGFFMENTICFYTLQTYENKDQVTMNITFINITDAEVYFLYKLKG